MRHVASLVAWVLLCTALVVGGVVAGVRGRVHSRNGSLRVAIVDRDFDGRADTFEYYDRGALTRRETDRDFDGRIDLVEEFDPRTGERTRSEVDANRDGETDFVVVFTDGAPVSTTETPHPPPPRGLHHTIGPFRGVAPEERSVGVWTAGSVPRSAVAIAPIPAIGRLQFRSSPPSRSCSPRAESPRGPPSSAI